jgi:hypothetical protein
MLNDARARVRDTRRRAVVSQSRPPARADPAPASDANVEQSCVSSLTGRERELIQDWMAKRYLQLHDKRIGRRRTDLPMPATVRSSNQAERLMNYLRR